MKIFEVFKRPLGQVMNEAFLLENFKNALHEFSQEAPQEEVQAVIQRYRDLSTRNRLQGQEKDINFWRKQGYEAFSEFVQNKEQEATNTQKKKGNVKGESITLHENNEWLVVVPLDSESSCFHGKGTEWCTANPSGTYFNEYFHNDGVTLVYFLQKQSSNKWAMAIYESGETESFDKNDRKISEDTLLSQTGISEELLQKIKSSLTGISTDILNARNTHRPITQKITDLMNQYATYNDRRGTWKFDKQSDNALTSEDLSFLVQHLDASTIVKLAVNVIGTRIPEAEQKIIQDPYAATRYATRILNSRWPEAELEISKIPAMRHIYEEKFNVNILDV